MHNPPSSHILSPWRLCLDVWEPCTIVRGHIDDCVGYFRCRGIVIEAQSSNVKDGEESRVLILRHTKLIPTGPVFHKAGRTATGPCQNGLIATELDA